ncbi:MAG: hypothetical protein JWM97_1679 [Phycisphaerales bacterium]|nr:hypothetical protein [Phycisphaerales bacterium]
MMHSARPILLCAAAANAAWLAGCAGQARPPEKIDNDVWTSPHFGAVEHTESVVAAEGSLPLVFQLQQSATVSIVDESTGKQIVTAPAKPGDIVVVDANNGVHIGGRRFAAAVAADHRHAIKLNFEPPAPAAPPATQDAKKE